LRGTRRRIAEHLSVAHREIPAVTFVEECDFSGIDLTRIVALTMKSAAVALRTFPALNARLEEDAIVEFDRVDIAVAVQTDDGLVVPVVRNCDSKSVEEIAVEVRSLAERARARSLEPGELRDSTFTVSNGGRLGGVLATPLINHPEVAILGLHRIVDRPVVVDGEVVVRPIGNISLTFDHRVVDGMTAASFVGSLIGHLHELSR
jgi:pyruvate/2-oxoglutarate dehydrogenase complex dihydrolipoamide acyltransferase (E2) component